MSVFYSQLDFQLSLSFKYAEGMILCRIYLSFRIFSFYFLKMKFGGVLPLSSAPSMPDKFLLVSSQRKTRVGEK